MATCATYRRAPEQRLCGGNGIRAHLVASKSMELVVADDERDAVEHPLRVEDRLVLHARHVVEVDDDTELVE